MTSMEMRRIGSLEVTVVGLGCNNFGTRIDERATHEVVNAALDAGINFLDTADIYGKGLSEEFIGRALEASGRRGEVVLASKFGKSMGEGRRGAHPACIRRAVEDSLRRLRTDRIDLYQQHEFDADVPLEDTLGALDELVREGKVREIGSSNFTATQVVNAERIARSRGVARFVSVQNEYSLLEREPERGVLDECARVGAAFLPYYPLAAGLLSGKYRRGESAPPGTRLSRPGGLTGPEADDRLRRVEALRGFAASRGHELLELAFSWLLARREVASVIAGATKPEQVRANVRAAEWKLTAADLAGVDRASA
jgi:aryl-alcohol dehydrogenase-like predicted oxidoreductase